MFDSLWAIVFAFASALESQGRRVEELERRVNELERLLQPPPVWTPDFLHVANASFRPEEIFRVAAPPAPLGFTIYERGQPPRVHIFESERGRIFSATIGVDKGSEGGDRTAVVFVRREASPEGDFRSRFVNVWPVEKESEK